MKQICLLFLAVIQFSLFAQDTAQKVVSDRQNGIAQQHRPYVILISADGFRWDYATKFNAKNIIALRDNGVQADYLKPSYPSLTFPNHYTLVTGLYPAHHGVVDNTFYDKTRDVIYKKSDKKMALDNYWYKGKPLWTLAEQQKLLSAVFYWPGSEIEIEGIKPTYYYEYNEVIPMNKRLGIVKNWLSLPEAQRPHFIALYFPQIDKAGHSFSPDGAPTKDAVMLIDSAIGELAAMANETGLDINFVFLSDHGMVKIDQENTIPLPKAIDLNQFKVPTGTALLHVYANKKKYIKPTYKALKKETDFEVYLTKNIPEKWKYDRKNDVYNRVGDMILVPKLPKVFSINGIKPDMGQHGFDPDLKEMHTIFYAWGPQLKNKLKIPAFENVHVYPFIAKLLGLNYDHQIDGDERILAPILK